ncbi:MAG: hypothetical protein IJL67_12585 [Oscillospiraceae bacterium]|nr:hypothetical protein [Oscillospiraceae bacterium]
MAIVPTGLSKTITASEMRARMDANAKKLVRHRIILAWILKECVPEFKDLDVKYIENNCFAGEVKMNVVSVDQDRPDADTRIKGSDTVDLSENEGEVRFDIVFDAVIPDTQKTIRVIINIEIQVKTDMTYSLVTRGIYYGSRLISRQKGTAFKNQEYQDIQKVYSIWICPSPKNINANSIVRYGITKKDSMGNAAEEPAQNYDKMDIVIISLNDDSDANNKNDCSDIVRLLTALLSTGKDTETRKKILDTEFGIPMTKEIEKEVFEMCNIGYAIETRAREEGIKEGKREGERKGERKGKIKTQLENVRTIMKKMNKTAKEAMDFLDIPEKDRKVLIKELETEV